MRIDISQLIVAEPEGARSLTFDISAQEYVKMGAQEIIQTILEKYPECKDIPLDEFMDRLRAQQGYDDKVHFVLLPKAT
jgi:hypothetical protein